MVVIILGFAIANHCAHTGPGVCVLGVCVADYELFLIPEILGRAGLRVKE
jgi:hypothetical protein